MSLPFAAQPLLQTLPLQIADHIGASIVDGRFPPGSRLREVELATLFEVSRATIREALRLLEQRGLVRIAPQRGAHVTQLSAQELDDLFEVRASLLATGSRLAAGRCTAADARQLRVQLEALRAAVADFETYVRTSHDTVMLLMRLSGNRVLADYITDFAQRVGRYVRLGLLAEPQRKRSVATWAKLIAAVAGGHGDLAAELHRKLALDNRGAALEAFRRQSVSQAEPALAAA